MRHRRIWPSLAVWIVAIALPSLCVAAVPPSALVEWHSFVTSKGTNLVFDEYARANRAWPSMPRLSVGQDASPEMEQARFVVSSIIGDTRTLVREANASADAKGWTRIEAAVDLRDTVLRGGQYIDLVLADALTRGIVVALCKRLGDMGDGGYLSQSLSRVGAYQIPLEKWISVAREEFGISRETLEEVQASGTEEERFRSFWGVVSKNDNLFFPGNVQAEGSLDLVKTPNMVLLLHRYIQTDVLLKKLTVAVEYRSRVKDFSLNDSEEKISSIIPGPKPTVIYVLGKDGVQKTPVALDPAKYTLGERVLGLQVSSREVASLLRAIKSSSVEKLLFFDLSDVIPPK